MALTYAEIPHLSAGAYISLMTTFRGSLHIYGTMDDAVRLVAILAKRITLELGDVPVHFSVQEDWFDSFKWVGQWLEYNEDLTTDDLPERRKVLEISCVFNPLTQAEPDRFVENVIDAALAEFYRSGGQPKIEDPASIPWASSSAELDEDEIEHSLGDFQRRRKPQQLIKPQAVNSPGPWR